VPAGVGVLAQPDRSQLLYNTITLIRSIGLVWCACGGAAHGFPSGTCKGRKLRTLAGVGSEDAHPARVCANRGERLTPLPSLSGGAPLSDFEAIGWRYPDYRVDPL